MMLLLISFIYLRIGIYLHLVNACEIKLGQLKMLIAVKPYQLFFNFSLACHIIYSACRVPTISVLTLALLNSMLLGTR
jgi:hypothetical protein